MKLFLTLLTVVFLTSCAGVVNRDKEPYWHDTDCPRNEAPCEPLNEKPEANG